VNRSRTDIGPGADQGNRKKSCSALLGATPIGVELSDEDQLWPEQSTSAIVLHHPQARYFNV
jgi:5-methyltetrahydrofolate--homocysteine methyltransferase